MRLLLLKLREWWTAGRAHAAAEVLAYREADCREAEAVYIARMDNLRRIRRQLAMLDKAPTLIREIVSR